jgi:uncharacterized protein
VTDLGATPGVKIKLIDHADLYEKMNQKYGNLYAPDTIKAGTYPTQDKDNKITTVWNIMVVNAKMPDQLAYDIIKTTFDKKADWVAVHREANELKLENQSVAKSGVPFHPGAIKYLTEQGVKIN